MPDPIEDQERIEDEIDRRMAAEARKSIANGEPTIPWEEVKAALHEKPSLAALTSAANA
jgi:hypothetical protein